MSDRRRSSESRAPFLFEMAYRPNLGVATAVSRCATAFYARHVGDRDVLSRLRVATQELLENTALYSSDGTTKLRIEIGGSGYEIVIAIRTINRADADDIARLSDTVRQLNEADDPAEHYQALLRRVAGGERLAGLGLGRIKVEQGLEVSLEVDGDHVSIVATTRCPGRATI